MRIPSTSSSLPLNTTWEDVTRDNRASLVSVRSSQRFSDYSKYSTLLLWKVDVNDCSLSLQHTLPLERRLSETTKQLLCILACVSVLQSPPTPALCYFQWLLAVSCPMQLERRPSETIEQSLCLCAHLSVSVTTPWCRWLFLIVGTHLDNRALPVLVRVLTWHPTCVSPCSPPASVSVLICSEGKIISWLVLYKTYLSTSWRLAQSENWSAFNLLIRSFTFLGIWGGLDKHYFESSLEQILFISVKTDSIWWTVLSTWAA